MRRNSHVQHMPPDIFKTRLWKAARYTLRWGDGHARSGLWAARHVTIRMSNLSHERYARSRSQGKKRDFLSRTFHSCSTSHQSIWISLSSTCCQSGSGHCQWRSKLERTTRNHEQLQLSSSMWAWAPNVHDFSVSCKSKKRRGTRFFERWQARCLGIQFL